jgi:hypothetical protein
MKVLACFLYLFAVFAQAQSASSQQTWAQEPDSFFNIRFGVPITASIPECAKMTGYGTPHYDIERLGTSPCFKSYSGFYAVENIRDFFNVYVFEVDGKVESISCKFNNGNAASFATLDAAGMASALAEKFGPAHHKGAAVVHTNAGVAYENQMLTWKGSNVEIDFDSVSGEYNHGIIAVYTAKYAAHMKANAEREKSAVSGVF